MYILNKKKNLGSYKDNCRNDYSYDEDDSGIIQGDWLEGLIT